MTVTVDDKMNERDSRFYAGFKPSETIEWA